ncbi:hypothetical protein [Synechococcus sp. UW105]|uniref:hypothetical protein n=1 Tax=Synechococcus sp. UW105 TaxID=337067 RepID=UPI000E0FF052|nr:hypothetical protein [Synechococcus sp. UW105]
MISSGGLLAECLDAVIALALLVCGCLLSLHGLAPRRDAALRRIVGCVVWMLHQALPNSSLSLNCVPAVGLIQSRA